MKKIMKRMKKLLAAATVAALVLVEALSLTGCGEGSPHQEAPAQTDSSGKNGGASETEKEGGAEPGKNGGAPELAGKLVYEDSAELQYAENFSIDHYEGGFCLLTTKDGTRILIVPEGEEAPEGLPEDMIVLKRPVKNLYLVASAVMDMFDSLSAIDAISLSGQEEDGWYIESAREAMRAGKMVYAGKYNRPDYELIVSKGCSLAIENRMITHSPEVLEMLQDFGVPAVVEYSSYESHPLGRVEWIKFFGALVGEEREAEEIFAAQCAVADRAAADERTDATVAFFFVTSNGLVQVRQSSDYVPKMIEMAGGRYIFDDLGDEETGRSTLNMQAEEFYSRAKDADFLIYNSSIDGGVASVEELTGKCPLLKDFKAVKEGNVFCTTNDMYQQTMSIGGMIGDIHKMLWQGKSGEVEKGAEMEFLFHLS